jgi:hypothetical protein
MGASLSSNDATLEAALAADADTKMPVSSDSTLSTRAQSFAGAMPPYLIASFSRCQVSPFDEEKNPDGYIDLAIGMWLTECDCDRDYEL